MSRLLARAGALLLLAAIAGPAVSGCAGGSGRQGPVKVQIVKTPIPTPCSPNLGPEPAYADTPVALAAAPDIYQQVKLLLEGRLQREQRLALLSAALQACVAVAPAPGGSP